VSKPSYYIKNELDSLTNDIVVDDSVAEFESNNATDDEYIPPTKVPRITRETVRRLDINSAKDISDISSIDTHEDKLPVKRKNTGTGKESNKPKFSNKVFDSLKEVQCYKCSNMITMCKIIDHFTKEHPRFQKLRNTYYGDKRPYMCGLCNASLSHEISQKEHLCFSILPTKTVRGKIEVYICKTCGLEFKSSSSYISHITSVHEPEKAFKCSQCNHVSGTGGLLYSHVQRRHNATKMKTEGQYKCDICMVAYTVKNSYLCHMDKIHGRKRNQKGHFKCDICNVVFEKEGMLNQHNTWKHDQGETDKVSCEICGILMASSKALDLHLKQEHPTEEQIGNLECNCEKCNIVFSTSVDLNDHLASCLDNPKQLKCTMCTKNDSNCNWHSAIALAKHVGQVHRIIREVCDICSVLLKSPIEHHKRHTHGTTFTCDQCGKTLANVNTLRIHIRAMHENIRQYKCPECVKSYSSDHQLQLHRHAKHIKDVTYKCPHCSYFTYVAAAIPRHIKEIHERAKPHKCEYCDHEGFFYIRDKRKHIAITHPNKHFLP
jgi:hypothetical protein